MSNPVYNEDTVPVANTLEVAGSPQNLSRPLWVIAISTAVLALIAVLVFGYTILKFIQLQNALNEFSTPGAESSGANQPYEYEEPCSEFHQDNC